MDLQLKQEIIGKWRNYFPQQEMPSFLIFQYFTIGGELFFFSKKKSFEMMELSSKFVIFVAKTCRSVNKKVEVFAE